MRVKVYAQFILPDHDPQLFTHRQMMQLPPIEIGLLISTVNVDRELQNFISIQTNPTTDAIYRITHNRLWEREREG